MMTASIACGVARRRSTLAAAAAAPTTRGPPGGAHEVRMEAARRVKHARPRVPRRRTAPEAAHVAGPRVGCDDPVQSEHRDRARGLSLSLWIAAEMVRMDEGEEVRHEAMDHDTLSLYTCGGGVPYRREDNREGV
ncbi:hypothetical protein MTO96_002619 [Rhipicephalus appendiculatus]